MHDCMKRRLLYAAGQAYQPRMEVETRRVGWIEPPMVIRRALPATHRAIDQAIVGRVRDGVVVAFRGTLPPFFGGDDGLAVLLDWLNDGLSACVSGRDYPGGVHLGFSDSMRRLWEDKDSEPGVRTAIDRQLCMGARRHLFVTGHSKGGALANLCAWRAANRAEWGAMPVSVATIAAARAGNAEFAAAYAKTRIACLRYEVPSDPVPHLPPGPETPRWIRALARQFGSPIAAHDYHPVGLRVAGEGGGHRRWAGSRRRSGRGLLGRRGLGLEALLPDMLTAHAICPDSHYDRLVCTGEDGCSHGRG